MIAQLSGDSSTLRLKTAILLYEGSHEGQGFASIHPIRVGKGKQKTGRPTIAPGVPASRAALSALMRGLVGAHDVEFIEPNVLVRAPGLMVFWVPPGRRHVWFKANKPIGTRNGMVPLPGCVFLVTESDWRVWAVKGTSRPTQNTELFVSPFFNVWSGGAICTGSVKRPEGEQFSNPDAHTDAFFRSNFTHPNEGTKLITGYKGGCYTLWQKLLDGKLKSFPEKSLLPMNVTLGANIKSVLSHGGHE